MDDPSQPTRYKFQDEWRDIEIVQESIDISGGSPVILDIRITHHGPIMNDVIESLAEAEPMALRWTALDGTYLFKAVTMIDTAANWEEFREALTYWDVPSQNFVYADLDGNIGYQTPGKIPIRAEGHQGLVPVPGWTGDYEWQGFIPFEELPGVYNPATGFIATANNKVVPDDYPYHIAYEWAAPFRAQRITDLLSADESVTVEDIRNIHAQTYSLPAAALRPLVLAAVDQPGTELEAQALELLETWDLYLEPDRAGASIYEAWYWFFVGNIWEDELGEELMADYRQNTNIHTPLVIELCTGEEDLWFDDIGTPERESRDEIMRHSFSEAVTWLGETLGDEPAEWEWGRLHTKTFVHSPVGQSGIGILEKLFNSGTIAARGNNFTVDAAPYSFEEPFAMGGGVSQRMIVDLADLDSSLFIHTTGQSGQLFHPHREDMIPLWQNVEYAPLPFSRAAVEESGVATLTLKPQ